MTFIKGVLKNTIDGVFCPLPNSKRKDYFHFPTKINLQ